MPTCFRGLVFLSHSVVALVNICVFCDECDNVTSLYCTCFHVSVLLCFALVKPVGEGASI